MQLLPLILLNVLLCDDVIVIKAIGRSKSLNYLHYR
jgi:hypothetical protein